ncbi:MAG: hypothetical protein WAM28_06215, partial [Chlamydiales bacterium]
ASAKIDIGNAHDDVKKAYAFIMAQENPLVKFALLRMMVIKGIILNPEEASKACMTAIESLESLEDQYPLVQDLREIDLKKTSIIPDEKIAKGIRNSFLRSWIFAWLAEGHAAVNPEKAMQLINSILLEGWLSQLEPEEKAEVGIAVAKALLEIDPLKVEIDNPLMKARSLVEYTSIDDYSSLDDGDADFFKLEKAKIFLRIARVMVKQAKTKEDLNEAAIVFAQVQEILENEISESETSHEANFSSKHFPLLMDLLRFSIPVFYEAQSAETPNS